MKEIASTSGRDSGESALEELGAAVASRPFDGTKIKSAMDEVMRVGGMELCVEAAAVSGAFESITKVVDATGRRAGSLGKNRVMWTVMTLAKHRTMILLMGTSVAVAIIATRMRR